MARQLFVNLPVADLDRSTEFFSRLGFSFDPRFTDENATCMVVGDDGYVMLLREPFFESFTDRPVADATESTEVLVTVSAESRDEVDELLDTALAAGASEVGEPNDEMEWMYGRSFSDLDGHVWEAFWMDVEAMEAESVTAEEPDSEETGAAEPR